MLNEKQLSLINEHKQILNNIIDYEYVKSYFKGDTLPNGEILNNSSPTIEVQHNYCKETFTISKSTLYNRKFSCKKCCGGYENSFAYHIEVELGLKLEDVWDFEKNTVNPYHISKSGKNKVWIKCQKKDYHDSYEITTNNYYSNGRRCSFCAGKKIHTKDSFGYFLKNNNLLVLWSDDNSINPFEIAKSSNKSITMLCDKKDYHNEYLTSPSRFVRGDRCPQCSSKKIHPKDSFGQWLSDNNILHLWSKKNNKSPFEIAKYSNNKFLFNCDSKDYHNDGTNYININNFIKGSRCTYCSKSDKVHPMDSFGSEFPEKLKYWVDEKVNPYKVSRCSDKVVKYKCSICESIFEVQVKGLTRGQFCCKTCAISKGEKVIIDYLKNNEISYEFQKKYEGLLGLGNGLLSYDFYLPDYNLLIEYQGEFHDGTDRYKNKDKVDKQQEHDRRKRQYAKDNNIELLEIWYYDFDKIEDILNKVLI